MEPHSEDELRSWLVERVSTYLDLSPELIDPEATWGDLGLVSRDAVALSGELESYLGLPLSPTIAWEHPTVVQLTAALRERLGGPGTAAPVPGGRSGTGLDEDDLVAVVGVGCRLPGGTHGPEAFWRMLLEGRDGIRTVPPGRWDDFDDGRAETAAVLSRTTRWGGFLDDIAGFDADFFAVSAIEAAHMDPQQRMLLEVAHEALDDAGMAREQLRGTPTGVFVGATSADYGRLTTRDLTAVDAWTGTGAALSIIANRLSYVLDLRGPSLVVDTACSSSLVAVHLAVESLRRGESSTALAGGVSLLLSPATTVTFDRAGAMAADGRCKAFDARADGYVRSEGCGVVVLKRLTDARRDGNAVLAVIRGSAVGSDGRSNGLMAPNPTAQEDLLRQVYRLAGVAPAQVDYVEAHGTGTPLGDRMEAGALAAVCGPGRGPDRPLLIGSVKTNLGHLEAAAGVVGLIKTALSVAHGRIPPSVHLEHPQAGLDAAVLAVPVRPTPWPSSGRPSLAGVSAFGFGGTNAHVVLEQVPPGTPGGVWLFPGQGSQWAGMGQQLLLDEPVFAAAVDQVDEVLTEESGFSARAVLSSGASERAIDRVQPLLFAVQIALVALWRAHDVRPDAVIGHSMGEITAAVTAGALRVEDGVRLVARRSRLMRRLAGQGAMAALDLPVDEVTTLLHDHAGVSVAVFSSPCQTMVAGPAAAVAALVEATLARGVRARPVPVDVASHSALVDPLLPDLLEAVAGLEVRPATVPFYSTVGDGGVPAFDPPYWAANLRRPVRFQQAVERALDDGHTRFVEISAHPLLLDAVTQTAGRRPVTVVPSSRRGTTSFNALHPPLRSWRHTTHWVPPRPRPAESGAAPAADTLLGSVVGVPTVPESRLWTSRLHPQALPYPAPHLVAGVSVVPGSVLLNTILSVAEGPVGEVRLAQPLLAETPSTIRVAEQGGRIRLVSRPDGAGTDVVHLTAVRLPSPGDPSPDDPSPDDPAALPDPGAVPSVRLPPADVARLLAEHGVVTSYRWEVREIVRQGTSTRLRVAFPAAEAGVAARLDAVLTLASFAADGPLQVLVPARIAAVRAGGAPCADVVIRYHESSAAVFDVTVDAQTGPRLLTVTGLTCAGATAPVRSGELLTRQVNWRPLTPEPSADVLVPAPGRPGGSVAEVLDEAVAVCLEFIARLGRRTAGTSRLTVITHGVRSADASQLPHAALWGLALAAAEEDPQGWGGIVDLDRRTGPEAAAGRPSAGGGRAAGPAGYAPVLAPVGPADRPPLCCRPDAAYLVTGGLGALGLEVARHLADRGARRLVLLGRRALPPRTAWDRAVGQGGEDGRRMRSRIAAVRELEALGVIVETPAVDVADEELTRRWLADRDAEGLPSVGGLVHAAGTTRDATLAGTDDEVLRAVLRPKLAGALVLDRAFPPGTVDFFVLFSSAASVSAVAGQGAYAAANACLDAVARRRAALGCRALSINWGAWADLGMATSSGGRVVEAALAAAGLRPLLVSEALAGWDRLDRSGCAQGLVVATTGNPELLNPALRGPDDRPAAGPVRWAGLSGEQQLVELRRLVAAELGVAPDDLDVDVPLAERGMDSILALRIRKRIEQSTGGAIGVTALWNHPTVRALARHLGTDVGTPSVGTPSVGTAPVGTRPGPLPGLESLLRSIEGAEL